MKPNLDIIALEYERTGSIRGAAKALGYAESTLRGWADQDPDIQAVFKAGRETDELPVIHRDYTSEEVHYVYPFGDLHLGAIRHNGAVWKQWLDYLYDRKCTSMLGTGDFLNVAITGSKSDVYDEQERVGDAKRTLAGQLEPIKDRIDVLMPGNHEMRIIRAIGDCPIRDVSEKLAVPYVEAAAMLLYHVGDQEYEVYVRHGTGTGQSLMSLAKSGAVVFADVYVTGHTHRQAVTADDYFIQQKGKVIRKKRYFVSSGSFMGYERYAAERGYPPSRIGAPRVRLDGKEWSINVSL